MNWVTDKLAINSLGEIDGEREFVQRTIHVSLDVRDAFSKEEPYNPIPSKINDLVDLIQEHIDNGLRVMIYCSAGMDRSPFVAASYLVKTENLSYGDAYKRVQKERPQTITHFEWAELMANSSSKLDDPVELKLKTKGKKMTLDLGNIINAKDEDTK